MAPPTLPGPDETEDDAQWRTAGDRIQTLLDASSSGGAAARERAEQLVREVTDLYGAVLERMMDVASGRGSGPRGPVRGRRPRRQPPAGARVASVRRRAAGVRRAGQRAALPRVARWGRVVARGGRRCGSASVPGQLQDLSVVIGHVGAGRRGRGPRRRAGDLLDRSRCSRAESECGCDSGRVPADPASHQRPSVDRMAAGPRARRVERRRGRRLPGVGCHRAGVPCRR